jgi:hypothetical protein
LVLAALLVIAGWFLWLYSQIHYYATHDQARPADAIAVFGAAEYDGRPSPVLRARLDHALALYREKLAPLVVTLGGGDGGPHDSEGAVGHDYLLAHGVPEDQIIAETQSTNTEESAARLAGIARENHLNRILAVSDFAPAGSPPTQLLGCPDAPDARDDQLHTLEDEDALRLPAQPADGRSGLERGTQRLAPRFSASCEVVPDAKRLRGTIWQFVRAAKCLLSAIFAVEPEPALCSVSGHDFGRAVQRPENRGFSPCFFSVNPSAHFDPNVSLDTRSHLQSCFYQEMKRSEVFTGA